MNKKTQTMVILGLVAVGGYMWWKGRKDSTTEGTSSFSNISGYNLRKKLEKKCDKKRNANKSFCDGI